MKRVIEALRSVAATLQQATQLLPAAKCHDSVSSPSQVGTLQQRLDVNGKVDC